MLLLQTPIMIILLESVLIQLSSEGSSLLVIAEKPNPGGSIH